MYLIFYHFIQFWNHAPSEIKIIWIYHHILSTYFRPCLIAVIGWGFLWSSRVLVVMLSKDIFNKLTIWYTFSIIKSWNPWICFTTYGIKMIKKFNTVHKLDILKVNYWLSLGVYFPSIIKINDELIWCWDSHLANSLHKGFTIWFHLGAT